MSSMLHTEFKSSEKSAQVKSILCLFFKLKHYPNLTIIGIGGKNWNPARCNKIHKVFVIKKIQKKDNNLCLKTVNGAPR